MKQKILWRITPGQGLIGAVAAFLTWFCVLWLFKSWSLMTSINEAAPMLALALTLSNALISKLPFTGPWVTVYETIGTTLACVALFPTTSTEVLCMLAGFGTLISLSSWLRVARLKKEGYAEEVPQ